MGDFLEHQNLNRFICDGYFLFFFVEPLNLNWLYLEVKLQQRMQYESRLCLYLHLHPK
jgi:hypothetical protein